MSALHSETFPSISGTRRRQLARSTKYRVECVDGSRLGRAGLDRGIGVSVDASVAERRDGHSERDQLARLRFDARGLRI